MHPKHKKLALLLLGIISLTCSKIFFFLLDDPEGPNLLIVTVLALVIYFFFLTLYYVFNFIKQKYD